jgi:8-oxo-dGTP diphosphatase
MDTEADARLAGSVEIIVRAVIGQDEQLLLVRQRGDEYWLLPGGHVKPGEPAEAALRRKVSEVLTTQITSATFLAVIEHGYVDRRGTGRHEMNLVFDVTLTDVEVRCADDQLEMRWTAWDQLSVIDLHPTGLPAGLRSGRFDRGHRWLPWQPCPTTLR